MMSMVPSARSIGKQTIERGMERALAGGEGVALRHGAG